jgi:hypothetical protein
VPKELLEAKKLELIQERVCSVGASLHLLGELATSNCLYRSKRIKLPKKRENAVKNKSVESASLLRPGREIDEIAVGVAVVIAGMDGVETGILTVDEEEASAVVEADLHHRPGTAIRGIEARSGARHAILMFLGITEVTEMIPVEDHLPGQLRRTRRSHGRVIGAAAVHEVEIQVDQGARNADAAPPERDLRPVEEMTADPVLPEEVLTPLSTE